jgi:uncharacterized protein YukE
MGDVHIDIHSTMLAGESLEQSARKIGHRVEEFTASLKEQMHNWQGGAQAAAQAKLDQLVLAFNALTEKCVATGGVIRQVAHKMSETERRNMARFGEL